MSATIADFSARDAGAARKLGRQRRRVDGVARVLGGPQIGGLVESQLTMAVRTVRAAGYALETEQV